MRDTNRIKPFMKKLTKIWKEQCPDWRFGQLISNLEKYSNQLDLFFVEEDEFIDIVENYFNLKNK